MSAADECAPSGESSPVLAVRVVLESKDSEVTRTLAFSHGTTIGRLWDEGAFGAAAGLGAHRAWLCLGPAPVYVPLLPEVDVFEIAQCFRRAGASSNHVVKVLFRASKEPSPTSTPELSRAKPPACPALSSPRLARARSAANAESEKVGGVTEAVVNDVEPFTQEKVSDLDLHTLVELPVADGRVVAVHLESLKEFVQVEQRKGVPLFDISFRVVDNFGRPLSIALCVDVWVTHLLRVNVFAREFGQCFLAVQAENRYYKALFDLHGDPLISKGVKFLYLDAAKAGADHKLRKDRLDRAQTAFAFVSPIYFPQKRSRDFLLNFPTAAGVAYPALFGEAFDARVKEGSACTGHELAPMLKALFKLDNVRVDEDYELFSTYWKSLSLEERADMQSAPSDYIPPPRRKGKHRAGVWPFGSYQMCTL